MRIQCAILIVMQTDIHCEANRHIFAACTIFFIEKYLCVLNRTVSEIEQLYLCNAHYIYIYIYTEPNKGGGSGASEVHVGVQNE
jgi:hypothetical protein